MLANLKNQNLEFHSIAVGLVSIELFKKNYETHWNDIVKNITNESDNNNYNIDNIKRMLFNAGIFHDIGKLDNNFQSYLQQKMNSKSFKNQEINYDVQIEDSKKIDINEYPLHQEISWAFLQSIPCYEKSNLIKSNLFYTIYWHHAKLVRKDKDIFITNKQIISSANFDIENFVKSYNIFIQNIEKELNLNNINFSLYFKNVLDYQDVLETNTDTRIPEFQSNIFKNVVGDDSIALFKNSLNHLFRSILVTADRIVSRVSSDLLEDIVKDYSTNIFLIKDLVDNSLLEDEYSIFDEVELMKERFIAKSNNNIEKNNRNILQEEKVKELSKKGNIAVLQGPAGVGKTKMMLEWASLINNGKKIFIIAPKTTIVEELYNEIGGPDYLPNISIEKITGVSKERRNNNTKEIIEDDNYFTSHINITTIDQVMSMMLSHNRIDAYLDLLNSNIIFDEFHEFMDAPGFVMLFIETLYLKMLSNFGKCLLVSATPNPFLLEKAKISEDSIVKIKTFNNTKYIISEHLFDDANKDTEIRSPMFDQNFKKGTICVFNTASKSQVSSIKAIKRGEEKTLNYHSKFFQRDRSYIFSRIMKEFGKRESKTKDFVLRTGPILQASIDISTNHMITEISTIDNILQRLGRVERWADNPIGYLDIYIPNNFNDITKTTAKVLNQQSQHKVSQAFITYLRDFIFNRKDINLNELYDLYFEFFSLDSTKKAYEEDWLDIKNNAYTTFSQGFEPIKIYIKKSKKKTIKVNAKKSLRNNSIFALVSTLKFEKDNKETKFFHGEDVSNNIMNVEKNFTFSNNERSGLLTTMKRELEDNYAKNKLLESIREDLLVNMKTKNKNISKIAETFLIDYARSELTPLIFSYNYSIDEKNMQQKFNIIYENINIGLMSQDKFNTIK